MFWNRLLQDAAVEEECPSTSSCQQLYIIIISIIGGVIGLVFVILNIILLPKRRERTKKLHNELLKHALITGGSSGIGLEIAKDLVRRNCKHVTLVARNEKKLEEAKRVLEQLATAASVSTKTVISVVSVDVSDPDKISTAAAKVCSSDCGAPTMLFNVAGTPIAKSFLDLDYNDFDKLMKINYLGSAYTTRAFLPFMISSSSSQLTTQDKLPRSIVFTSSQAGQLGIYGFTAYSASKFALRGLAEALHMEIARDNVSVQLAFPPDTDTPGFELEQIDKPEETKLISETSGLFQPDSVAKTMVSSALKRRPPFFVYFGLEGWMLATLTAGMSPVHTSLNALCQIFLMSLLRFVGLFYLMDFRRIVSKVGRERKNE
mmetsp:Transcript_23939/g.30143  ORF Transcript_23939/g.30143 Transcript_23939/m.30143 type:complete len:375 (+) Transcript_23939:92-1216(+)